MSFPNFSDVLTFNIYYIKEEDMKNCKNYIIGGK